MNQDIASYVSEALTQFGKEVNLNRQFAILLDGLKPVYRRSIYVSMGYTGTTTKTQQIVGEIMGKYHPHGDKSIADVVSSLVRWGILTGQGNHGLKMIRGEDIAPSHPRYTEAKISDVWHDIFKDLLPYVPYKECEIPGNVEPVYLPTPLPMGLLFSGQGIGYGANCRYPMFTAKSMMEALQYNDPSRLQAPFGLLIDHANSDLKNLWDTGLGKITYKYQVTKCGISSGYGSMISGSSEIFKPDLDKAFEEELAKGQVYILDQTDGDIPKVFVGRSPNVRAITLDDIQDTCEQVCSYSRVFRLTVSDGNNAFLIPMKTWLQECYDNYIGLINKFKQDQIDKLNFDYQVYTWLPIIAQCQFDHRDWDAEKISTVNKCDLEVVKSILKKSISTLRNAESTDKLKAIQNRIKYYRDLDPNKYTVDLINRM